MQAVILCGGLGTRLREETEFKPKPMIEIGGRPILWHIMKIFARQQHTDFVLVLGYKGEQIKQFFFNYELMNNDVTLTLGQPGSMEVHPPRDEEQGWRVTLADTGKYTLKGGRVKRVERYVSGDSFFLTYGDGVADIDLRALLRFHREHGRIATVTGVARASRFGELKADGDRVESFTEKPRAGTELINGGFFVFERKVFDYLSPDESCDLEFGVLERLAREDQLRVYRHRGFWACMDTPRDVDYLNDLWRQRKAEWKLW